MNSKHIILDPGHGGTLGKDHFRQGPSAEREEWINLRVCKALKLELEAKGYIVSFTRKKDVDVDLQTRVDFAISNKADLFVSVHHASCDPVDSKINFPFMYIHGTIDSEKKGRLARCFQAEMSKAGRGKALIFSDHWVFEDGLFVLRELEKAKIPAILTEFSFFSHPEEEQRLKTMDYCGVEAEYLANSIHRYFNSEQTYNFSPTIFPFEYKRQLNTIRKALLEEGRSWRNYYLSAEKLIQEGKIQEAIISFEKALAINPYHENIVSQLENMFVHAKNLKLEEHSENLSGLLDCIW